MEAIEPITRWNAASRPSGRTRRGLLLGTTALTSLLAPLPAPAQEAAVPVIPADQGPPAPRGPEALELPTLSVEASGERGYKADEPTLPKLTERLVNTPQTIDVVPQQVMQDQGDTTLRDALRNVPGISLAAGEFSSQGDNLTIRGFTARNDIYLDGMRDFGSYYRDPFYLDDIQVLKGPSSLLFGRGSTGGVVEQDSKRPLLTPLVAGTLAFGTDLTKRVTADVNQPLPDWGQGAALRLDVMAQNGGLTDRNVTQNSRFGLAPSLALGLGTPTRLTLSYLHQSEYDIPDYGVPWLLEAAPGTVNAVAHPAPLSLTQSNFYGFEHGDYLRTNVDVPTLRVEHDFGDGLSLRDQVRYGHYTRQFRITEPQLYTTASETMPGATGSPLLIVPGTPLASLQVARNELYGTSLETFLQNQTDLTAKFRTGFVEHDAMAGVEIGRETSDPVRYTTIGPYSLTPLLDPNPNQAPNVSTYLASRTNTIANTAALYLLDTLKLNEQWQIMGGVRLDRFDAAFNQTVYNNPVTGAGAGYTALSHLDQAASWRGAVIYKPLPNGTVYFDAGTSFNPSAEALSLTVATASLAPERNKTYEVGSKWELLDNQLAVTGAIYQTEQTNLREVDPNNPLFDILAGDAVAKGIELESAGHLTPEWQVTGGFAYTFSEIDKSPITGPASDLGHRLGNVPMYSANLWTTYQLPWWHLQIGGGVDYASSRFASTTPTIAGGVDFWKEVPGYWTLNGMLKYPLGEKVALQLNLYNLADNKYYDQVHPSHVVPGAGTTALFTLSYKE